MDFEAILAAGACALAVSTAFSARADEPPPSQTATLDEVVVRVPRGELAQAPEAAATVIDADKFAGEAKGVAELLAVSPGVDVEHYGTSGQLATVAIRGVAADGVKVLIDGLPLEAAAGYVDLSTLPRAWIRKVQVVRGPAGAVFGAGALGGAVNVVTREAQGVEGEVSAGSFGTYSLSADAGTRQGGFSILAGATAETTQGDFPYRFNPTPDNPGNGDTQSRIAQNDASRRAGFLLKLGGEKGDYRIDALAQVSGGHRGLPGWVYLPTPHNWQDDGRALAMVRVAREVAPGLNLSARVHGQGDRLDLYIAGEGGVAHQRGADGGFQVEAEFKDGPAQIDALASADDEQWSGTALGGHRDRATLAAALSGDLRVGSRFHLGPAVRLERTGPFTGLSANLGASEDLPADFRIRINAGRTVRIPSFTELYLRQGAIEPNPGLMPVRGLGVDAALVYDGHAGLLSVGGFAEREDDIITYEPNSLGRFKPQNTPSALLRGLELEAATTPLPALCDLSLQAAFTLLRTELLAGLPDIVGNELPRRPRQQLYARLSIEPSPAEAHLDLRSVGQQYQDLRNALLLAAQTTLGAGVSLVLLQDPRLSVHLQVDNLTDRRDLVDGFGNPLPGRSVMITLRAGTSETGAP